ncbi:MAG: DapH/DapD/GlmU-related protein [Mycobacteriales bacterium]
MNLIFLKWWCPARLRVLLLRSFGATVGRGTLIRHRVRILWPWKLSLGNNVWLGEGSWLLNLEEIAIADDVCVSQEAFLCTGSHDGRSPTFRYDNAPIHIGRGAWVGARAAVLRGVTVGEGAVIGAGEIVRGDVAPGALCLSGHTPDHQPLV